MSRQTLLRLLGEIWPVTILAAMTVVHFWPVLSGVLTFVLPGDPTDLTYPDYFFIAQSLKSGTLPMWNPHVFGGMTYAGYAQYGLFYPLNIFFWIFPWKNGPFPPQAFESLALFHVWLAGVGTYLVLRLNGFRRLPALTAGVVYMFTPSFLQFIVWTNQITALAWLPLVTGLFFKAIWSPRVRTAIAAGFAFGIMGLASPAQPVIQELFLFAVIFVCWFGQQALSRTLSWSALRQAVTTGIGVAGLGLAIASVSLFPILEFTPSSIRFLGADGHLVGTAKMSYQAFTSHRIQLEHLRGLLDWRKGLTAVALVHFGALSLWLAALSVRARQHRQWVVFSFTLFAVSMLYALGVIFPAIFYHLPLLDKVREPQRYIILCALAVALASAVTMEAVLDVLRQYPWRRTLVSVGILLLLFGELHGVPYTRLPRKTNGPEVYYAEGQRVLESLPDDFRYAQAESSLGWPIPNGLSNLTGQRDAFGYGNPLYYPADELRIHSSFCDPYRQLMGVKYILVTNASEFRINNCRGRLELFRSFPNTVEPEKTINVYQNPSAFPPFRVVDTTVKRSVWPLWNQLDLTDLKRKVILETADFETLPKFFSPATTLEANIVYGWSSPNLITLRVDSSKRAIGVFSEIWYPGWVALVNGRPQRVLKVNGFQRGIMLNEGENIVLLWFVPVTVLAGAGLSLTAVAVGWWILFRGERR